MSQGRLFEEIARNLASPMPRRRALKTILGSIAGAALATVAWPGSAQADPTPKGGKCPPNHTNCGNVVCCPKPKECCVNVCCQPNEVCKDGQCVRDVSPSSPGSGNGQ
jgi:hypothetical protein